MFKTILVPTDASDSARHALKVAVNMARVFDSRIVLLHVIFTPEAIGYTLAAGVAVPQQENSLNSNEVLLATIQGIDTRQVPMEMIQKAGLPAAMILEEIKNLEIDLVIMGNRGYSPIAGALLGSVSQKVLSKAGCPVMIVNLRKNEDTRENCRFDRGSL